MLRKNLLVVCSRNKRRSLTAETIFRDSQIVHVKSCGTSPQSRIRINEKLIAWADEILVMEKRHQEIIRQQFSSSRQKKIRVLFIPDEYELMNETLIGILTEKIESV